MTTLRVAIAGAGWVSANHLQGWKRLANVEVIGVCDPNQDRATSLARRFGIPHVFSDAATMLDELRPGALDVAAPVGVHADICLLAADRGIDVLCQKPLCATYDEAERLVARIGNRIRLMVHENWRFRPHYRRIRQWVDAGAIGDPLTCRLIVRASGLLPNAEGRVPQLERQGYFATLPRLLIGETLVHHLDLLRWLLGPLRVVAGRMARISPAVVGEDCATLLLANEHSWATIDGNLSVPGAPTKTSDDFELVGTSGSVSYRAGVAALAGRHDEEVVYDLEAAYLESYASAIAHFVDCLRSGREFEVTGAEHLHTLRLVEDAYALATPLQASR